MAKKNDDDNDLDPTETARRAPTGPTVHAELGALKNRLRAPIENTIQVAAVLTDLLDLLQRKEKAS